MMNPLTLLSGFSLQTKALLIAGVFITGLSAGWQIHGWRTDAKQGRSINKQIKTGVALANDNKTIVQTKIVKEKEIKYVYRTIKEKINALDDDRVCFDAQSLGMWNAAIAGANTDTNRPKPARETATTDPVIANVKEVLTNAADNFETCNSNTVKHNALIDKVESLDGKMCICAQ